MKAAMKEFWETKYRSSTGLARRPSEAPEKETTNKYLQ